MERKAETLRNEALEIEDVAPRKALGLLKTLVEKYPDSWTVTNLVLDDIIRIATTNSWWNEAIKAAELAQRLKPRYKESYALEVQACRLHAEGKQREATEIRLQQSTLFGESSGIFQAFANKFAKLGAHDRAWRLYNKAVVLAAEEGYSPHNVRRDMAALLLKENKPNNAVEMMITCICEAQQFAGGGPKVLAKELRRALRAAGLNLRSEHFRDLPDEIVKSCKTEGREPAIKLFYAWKEQGVRPPKNQQ